MPKILSFILCFLFVHSVHAQEATPQKNNSDEFSLDEFSEGLEVKEENIQAPIKKEVKSTQVEEAPEDKEYEKLAVTGSHIKRANGEGLTPVQVVGRDMIEQSGHNSVSDVLRDLTASSFGGAREASGSNAAGVSSVNLRGLGSDKTLILLNGKRLPIDAVTGSPDLNLIPLAAVKQVEILKDGASATYGSDALGGVVNIITHKDYNGSTLTYQETFMTQFENGKTKQVEFITGSATARSSITTVLSFRENEKIFSADRPWTEEGISNTGSPGSFKDSDGRWKADPNCAASDIVSFPNGSEYCSYNFAAQSSEMPELRQLNIMSLFEHETDDGLTLYGRVSATKKDVKWNYAAAPGFFSLTAAEAAPLGIPGYAGGDVSIRYRTVELGNRETEIDTYSYGFQAGVKGNVINSWDWDLTFDRNTVYKNDLGVSGYGLSDEIESLIKDGSFKPFETGSARGSLDSAKYQPWQLSRSENNFTELKFTGEIASTSNGAVGAAVGATHTNEKFSTEVDDLSAAGKVFGSAGSNGGGERETKSFYVETIIPLAQSMELQLAGRYDEFSDFGNTTNPKLGFKWNVSKTLLVRASAGTGFKAPQLKDLYASASDGWPTFIDEVKCQEEKDLGGETPSCNPQQYNVRSNGNEDLEEEKAESYNIGVVWEPSRRNSLEVDVWLTKLSNVVDINYQLVTQLEREKGIAEVQKLGIDIVRDDDTNDIVYMDAPLLNLGGLEISGIDLAGSMALSTHFTLMMNHSHLFYYNLEFPGIGAQNFLRRNGYPAWRNNITIDYTKNKFSARFITKTIGEHEKMVREDGELPVYTEADMNVSYRWGRNTTTTLGVTNVFAQMPPLDESNQNNKLNADLYNPRGQTVFVGLKQRF